jgi:tetratricopeptide (TPR) repeat protein
VRSRHLASLAAVLAVLAPEPARAQLGIDLSAPPDTAKPAPDTAKPSPDAAKPTPAPAPLSMDELALDAVAPTGAAAERLAAAKKLLDEGRDEAAALAFDEILRQPPLVDVHPEARVHLASALARLGLHHAAAAKLDDAIATAPPGSALARRAADALLDLAQRSGDERLVLRQAGRLAGTKLDAAQQDRFQYLVAKASYERGAALQEAGRPDEARKSFDDARRMASSVHAAAGAVHARARFVEGLVDYAEGNAPAALESFKDVVRLTNPRRSSGDPRLRELAFLQLARLHYEHRQNRYAIFYYGKLPQDGESWLEALWESSYAHYRIGDYERALGNLLTLHSPYFKDEWFPESHLLKAIIYYENCRYPEARSILEGFERTHEPLHAALDRLASAEASPAAFYDRVVGGSGDPDPRIASRIARLVLADRAIQRLDGDLGAVKREATRGLSARSDAFRASPLAADLRAALDSERARLATEAGGRARHRLDRERGELRGLLEQSLRVKVEVTRREREELEASLARRAPASALKDYHFSSAVSDEELYWPYDGEFWRDELGTYAYTLTKGCRAGPRDVQVSR